MTYIQSSYTTALFGFFFRFPVSGFLSFELWLSFQCFSGERWILGSLRKVGRWDVVVMVVEMEGGS
jgi:hypothetical protein